MTPLRGLEQARIPSRTPTRVSSAEMLALLPRQAQVEFYSPATGVSYEDAM